MWSGAGTIFKQCCRCWFQTFNLLLLLSYLNVVCNNFNFVLWWMNYICELYITCDMYVELCMILVVCWLNQDPSWYSTDHWVYMGSSMTVRSLVGCHCTCALINWSILPQLVLEQDSTLFAICVFKTKVFVLQNQFWQLIDIYRCSNLKFKSKVCQWSFPLCLVKDFRWLSKY